METICSDLFGKMAAFHPHQGRTTEPYVLEAITEPGIHFRDLPPLATIRGKIIALDAGTVEGGVVAAGVFYRHDHRDIATARGPGTSQDGEALVLITYVRELKEKEGVYWPVVDSEAARGVL